MSLEPTLVVRSGFDVLRVNENELIMRVGMQRDRVPWSAVVSIEPYLNGDPVLRGATGVLVVRTATGAFELPATERPVAELPSLHALLLAYRRRAQLLRG